ncbi:MAG: phytase [bacterium]
MPLAHFNRLAIGCWFAVSGLLAQEPHTLVVVPRAGTSPVISEADDPAIWVHPADPSKSLIIGTDKGIYPDGGLFAWNLDGTLQQRINISHPNNVDVRHGLQLGGRLIDLAAVSMSDHRQVRIFEIDSTSRTLSDCTTLDSTNVLRRMFKLPYGLALYQRRHDRALFVIVSSRHNESNERLWQIRLEDDGTGRVRGTLVRAFGEYRGIVEGLVADETWGFLYASEENTGIHKYYANPEQGDLRLALFGADDTLAANYEGLALYRCSDSTGYLLVSRPGAGCIQVYRREGERGEPHRHRVVATIRNAQSESGDGLEITSRPHGQAFPYGFLIWHNQAKRNFQLYAWESVAQSWLTICAGETWTSVGQRSSETTHNAAFAVLQQNYPNPFNPSTAIDFVLKEAGPVQLTIYNILGEEVRRLLQATLPPGKHVVHWDGRDNAGAPTRSGVYLCRLRTTGFLETRRMILSR